MLPWGGGTAAVGPQQVVEHNDHSATRTIVAADNEVSNGFVKDGKSLPYVFEATESGK